MEAAARLVRGAALARSAFLLQTRLQRFHQIDDVGLFVFRFFRLDHVLTLALALDQIAQRIFVAVLKRLGIELGFLLAHDLGGDLDHLLVHAHGGDVGEEVLHVAHFVVAAQRGGDDAFAARLKCDEPLALRHDQPPKRDLAGFFHRRADDGVGLGRELAVGDQEIGIVPIEPVDVFGRHELVDVDGLGAFQAAPRRSRPW